MAGAGAPPSADPPHAQRAERERALLRRHGARVVADRGTFRRIAGPWGRPAVVDEYLRRREAALAALRRTVAETYRSAVAAMAPEARA